MDAKRYNRVRLALSRLGAPLRWQIATLRGLDIYLDADVWICGDRTLNDFPVIAWTAFDTRSRQGLHSSIECTMSFYHAHAGMIVDTVLENVDSVLEDRLGPGSGASPVSPLR